MAYVIHIKYSTYGNLIMFFPMVALTRFRAARGKEKLAESYYTVSLSFLWTIP